MLNNFIIADLANALITLLDLLASVEDPINTFVLGCGCLYLVQTMRKLFQPKQQDQNISPAMTVDRMDDSPLVEQNTLTQKMKQKSKKIVMDAERGEAKAITSLKLIFFKHFPFLDGN